ncbi:MAG: helix-hairpin-helix domain-containing protein [Verrucomicrobia bacterium]|nr:helix-hairpin-helix domain-containing protein [Verrucomicrobiota bacterium]
MKLSMLLLFFGIAPLWQLTAQTTDPELAQKLKAVMLLFDKNQQALKEEIIALNTSNAALTEANLKLYLDLQAAEQHAESLASENLILRSKISEVAVNELEAASLQPQSVSTVANPNARAPAAVPARSASRANNRPDQPLININTATKEQLATLPTIDDSMALQIISNRPYSSLEDLIINLGFGPMKLRRISPFVTVE